MIVPAIDLPDRRTSLPICVIFVIVFPILVTTDKHAYGNTYERKTEDNEFSENAKQSKHADGNENSMVKRTGNQGVSDQNAGALNRFLENVLRAQDDLKWIDHVVRDRRKNWDKSTGSNPELPNFDTSGGNKKIRDKRSFLWKTNAKKYRDPNLSELPQRVYVDSDMPFEKTLDTDDADTYQNGINEKETREYKSGKSSNGRDTTDDQLPKEWSDAKDICSLNDWLNSNKNFKTEQDKRGDRWIHDYESDRGNQLNPLKTDPRVNARYQRDETKKAESPSLESLKETILELKKSLNEDEKREHRAKEKEDAKERNTRAKSKHKKHEKDTESNWWDSSEPEADLRKREQGPDELSDKNARTNAWRRKRTEVNDDDGRKFFRRAGFGASYLEENHHDRKRRSKGTPPEKPCDDKNNLLTGEKISKETDCHDPNDLDKKEPNDLQTNYAIEQGSKPTSNFEDTSIFNGKGSGVAENYEQGNRIEKKLKDEGKDDSLGIFRSTPKPVSDQTSTLNKDGDAEEAKTRDKLFELEDRPYPSNDGTNTDRRTGESDEKRGKLLQEKRSPKDSENINILVKSENKNLIKFSNTAANSRFKGEQPYVLNRFDMKKKLYVENEEKPGKSVATVYNVKIEKAQVGTPVKDNSKQEGTEREKQTPFNSLDFGKTKVDEFDEKHGLTNDRRHDEERIENSVEINRGSTERGDHEGTQNWYKNNQFSTVDRNSMENLLENKENLNDNRMKEASIHDSNDRVNGNDASDLADKSTDHEEKNKRKFTQIVIVPDGLDDRKLSDMYGQRRILQYMEYSDDDVEDADASYGDTEEENQAEKSGAPLERKERSAAKNKGKAKVNVLIKEKLDKKKQKYRGTARKRRNPVSVIEYYDYDSDNEQREHETDEQERIKTSYDKNPIESDLVLDAEVKQTCIPPATKKDEHEAEMRKQEKLNNKLPKQEFIVHGIESQPKNVTEKTEERLASSEEEGQREQPGRLNQGEDNVNAISRGRLNQPISEREDKFLEGGSKDSYILDADKQSNPDMIDEFLEDIQSMDEKNEKVPDNFEPLYEELKKVYDWNQDEPRSKPRIKGDHRMYYGANDKLDPTNKMSESYTGQIELPETQGSAIVGAKTCSTESDYPESSNVSRSNYFALKSTDDMFKGGSEQSNSTEQKLRGPIGTAVEWREQKVSGASNDAPAEKDARSRSLTGRGQYIDTDSRSPYENRKYLESRLPGERVQNIDREKQTVISSGDLHESFVEPLDWIFDEDTRPRFSRSLKTIDQKPESSTMLQHGLHVTPVKDREKRSLITEHLLNVSTEISAVRDSTTKTTSTRLRPSLDLRDLFHEPGDRVKRQIRPHDTYDDRNRSPVDSEKSDYEYSKSDLRSSISKPNVGIAEDENYGKVARRASRKKKKQHRKRKHRHSDESKKRKKSHAKKSKYSGNNRRKRRHPKKHSNDLKTKHDHKKHKKRVPKTANLHSNVKKGKADDKIRDVRKESSVNGRKTRREKMDSEHTTNIDSEAQKKISSLLSIDNVEDESQMDSALHGDLAGKIVDHIFEQVQKNEDLKVSLGPGLYQKHKTGGSDKTYRQALNDDEINHATELLNKIMLLLNRLIFDEVQRKTCVSLSPDLTEFLDWILDVNPRRNSMDQLPSLPLVHAMGVPDHFPKDKFLFRDSPSSEMAVEFNELRGKLQLVEKLINEYRTLSEKEKTKVQPVHDYLSNQLDLLLDYVQAIEKEKPEFPIGGMTNASNSNGPNMVSPSSNSLKAKKSFLADEEYFYEDGLSSFRKGRRTIRSLDKHSKPRKKQGKRKKKHRKRHKGGNAIDQPARKDAVHKAATSRQKREYLDKEFRDSFESEYEEPLIYSSMDFESDDEAKGSLKENDKKISGSEVKREIPKGINDAYAGESNSAHGESKSNMEPGRKIERDATSASSRSKKKIINEKHRADAQLEEPITGKDRLEDEIILLNKQQSWKRRNEEQLEELAFGEDMRKGLKEKELFEKLTEIDKKISSENARTKRKEENLDCPRDKNDRNCNLSDEKKLRMLEEKINVYSDKK